MNSVISSENIPIKLWLDDAEEGAINQAKNLANLPFAFHHIAIMPDSHQGFGMPIGGVLATLGEVIPNAVGVDIGCGMGSVRTSLNVIDLNEYTLRKIIENIKKVVPVGFSHHQKSQSPDFMPEFSEDLFHRGVVINTEYANALKQIGTLGGGNHFIEIQTDKNGFIYFMVHSGSRNLGFKVAKYYNELAIYLNKKWYTSVPKNWDMAFFPTDSDEGQNYLLEMDYCVKFAEVSRYLMLQKVKNCFEDVFSDIQYGNVVNVAHNFAAMENHFGKNVLVYRKGATKAYKDQLGIIPGSQGTSSYIVKGKGNPDSFQSCSHGAGRKLGRKAAQRTLDLQEQIDLLNNAGVIHNIKSVEDLDEAPGSYKDIQVVMENQKDLVDIVVELKPLAVIKG